MATPRPQPGKPAASVPAGFQAISLLVPGAFFLIAAGSAAVAGVRWHTATRTCYVLTNRRALVYKAGLFGVTRDSYPPLEVANMRRSDSWLAADCGDLIFRSVQVISNSSNGRGVWTTRVKTIHYGFLAIPHVREVQKLVHETLIDRFVDKLQRANAL
jgi:hypothetical protein